MYIIHNNNTISNTSNSKSGACMIQQFMNCNFFFAMVKNLPRLLSSFIFEQTMIGLI